MTDGIPNLSKLVSSRSQLRTDIRFWVLLTVTAATVRALVAFAVFGGLPLISDARSYQQMAVQLLAGTLEAYAWPPGWPFALAAAFSLFGADAAVARMLVVAIGTLSTVLVVLLARRVLHDEGTARLAGWLVALYPPAVLAAGAPLSHHLTAFFLLILALVLIESWRDQRALWGLAIGLALGLTVLTRPSTLAFVPMALVAGVFVWWRMPNRRRWLAPAVVLALGTAGAVVAPVVCVNVIHGVGPVISTNNERNFFLGNNFYTPLYNTHHLAQRGLNDLQPEVRAYLRAVYERPSPREAMMQEALRNIANHPLTAALRTTNRARAFWGFDYISARQLQSQRQLSLLGTLITLAFEAGGYVVIALFIVAGLAAARNSVSTMVYFL